MDAPIMAIAVRTTLGRGGQRRCLQPCGHTLSCAPSAAAVHTVSREGSEGGMEAAPELELVTGCCWLVLQTATHEATFADNNHVLHAYSFGV
jgi:uncharacterized protein involved in response to NO